MKSSVRRYVSVPQNTRFGFQIFQPVFNHIANANDSDKLPFGNDGQMPQAMIGHQGHGSFQRIAGRNSNGVAGHHVQHRHGKSVLSMLRDRMYDVAFRYEAAYDVSTLHDQGGHSVRLHQPRGGPHRRGRIRCKDLATLAIQKILNAHEHPSVLSQAMARLADSHLLRCPRGGRRVE